MSERDLIEAFHDCIERLNAGQSVDDCLRAHPQQAEALIPLLATGQLVQQASSVADEVTAAQQRGRQRLEAALARQQAVPARRRWWFWPSWESGWAFRLATAVLLLIFLVGGTAVMVTAAAAGSLPGDRLYAVKQQNEQLQLWLSGHDPALAAAFEQRRRDETRTLIDLGREADVTFRGRVQVVDETTWLVDGLSLTVSDQVARPDSLVEVDARTTGDGRLLALTVRPLTPDDALPPPARPTTPPLRPTDRATSTPTRPQTTLPAITSTPTLTATAVSSPTQRPTQTASETPRPTDTRPPATIRPSETATQAEPTEERPSATATPQPTEERPTATPTSERVRP